MFCRLLAVVTLVLAPLSPVAAQVQAPPSIADRTASLVKFDGFVPLYWDEAQGRLLMEIARFDQEFLYQVSLATGVGSNPLGLDRAQVGPSALAVFERVGPRVLLVQRNTRFRAITDNASERRAVAESFASSVLWGFKVEAAEGGRVLVDATAFFLRDAHGVADRLRDRRQGRYRADESRSAIYLPRTKAFPKNTEVEGTLTFVTDEAPGPLVRETAPTPQAVTVRQHHSLVELPEPWTPRALDPRVGYFGLTVSDYASPVSDPIERRWISRHRLEKRNPTAARSAAVEPLVYYVDNGAPEPIRQALIDGASWWKQAFEAAGFVDAFRVEVLPPDADPMDIRYNVITWVHRSTRGWSYGSTVEDPRTGEILKGSVSLGSLRVRQNFMIGTGLTPPFTGEEDGACAFGDVPDVSALMAAPTPDDIVSTALARLRQLSAHEVGHTLGLGHNFAASTYDRASVMDYPAPLVGVRDGRLDFSQAYGTGVGAYDVWAIRYGYEQFAAGTDERAALAALVEDGVGRGLLYVSDRDARPVGAAHPLGSLWDNGPDPVAMLRQQMDVRRIALDGFGPGSLRPGEPYSTLEAKLLPVYLHHRYQLLAAAKALGGAYFTYAVKRGAGPSPTRVFEVVPAPAQRAALDAILDTLEPSFLALPPRILALIPPTASGYEEGTGERFAGRTGPTFDPLAAAAIAADLSLSALLEPSRAARLADFHARDERNPGAGEVVRALFARLWGPAALAGPGDLRKASGMEGAVLRTVQALAVTRAIELASSGDASGDVRAEARGALAALHAQLANRAGAHEAAVHEEIDRFLSRPDPVAPGRTPLPTPAGEPIGQ